MGPEWIVILGAIFGGTMLKMLESILRTNKSQVVKPTDVFGEVESPHQHACDALPTRVFEDRLVAEGIITVAEMTVCEDQNCKDCRTTRIANRKCAVASCFKVATLYWNKHEDLCKDHYEIRNNARSNEKGAGDFIKLVKEAEAPRRAAAIRTPMTPERRRAAIESLRTEIKANKKRRGIIS